MSKAISVLFSNYNNALISNPYRTKIITNGVIFGLADLICQNFIENKGQSKPLDYKRLFNMVMVGGLFAAPYGHLWYCKWAPAIVSRVTTNTKIQPVLSMFLDQVLFAPPLLTGFLFFNEYLKNYDFGKAVDNVQNKLWIGLTTNWKVWPPFQMINFTVIPIQFRVLFVNIVGFFWTIYLSYLQNSK